MLIGLFLAACGSEVETTTDAGSVSSSSSGGVSVCDGDEFRCVTSCDAIDSPVTSECIAGVWTCPSGTFDEKLCIHDPVCPDLAGACDVCESDAVQCNPTPDCLAGCPEVACSDCSAGPMTVKGCTCACNPDGQLTCAPQICCMMDIDCGDESYVPCVEGVCKQPVDGFCWTTAECPAGSSCIDVFVCPCGADCDMKDTPGYCEGPP